MTRDVRLTDDQVERMLRGRSSEPYPGLVRDILSATSAADQQRRWALEWPSSHLSVLAAAALLAALLIGGALAAGALRDVANPVPPPLRPGWTGPLHPDLASMPKIIAAGSDMEGYALRDTTDADPAGIDITGLQYSWGFNRRWDLTLRAPAPYPSSNLVEFGVVLDVEADGIADCLIGINNDTPQQNGEFRVWVTNLASGETLQQVGGPYGSPIDFATDIIGPRLSLFFLSRGEPCDLVPGRPAFYAWATESVDGEVVAWDYAPDAAWLVPGPILP